MAYQIIMEKSRENYCMGIKKLFEDIFTEIAQDIKDGIIYTMLKMDNDETEVYNFLKTEGYSMTYKEFKDFIGDCKKILEDNENEIGKIIRDNENAIEELDDESLKAVVGGSGWWKKNWKKVAIGAAIVAAVAVTAVVIVGTGGAAAAAAPAVASMTGMGSAAKVAAILGVAAVL